VVCFWALALFSQQTSPLKPGIILERALKGGESHSFEINLNADQFLQLSVEQKGIDVEVVLTAPDGKRISHMDSMNSLWGPEPLVVVAEQAGRYQVQVDSPDKAAAPGRYEIKIAALHPATAGDQNHVTAERRMEKASDQASQGDPDSLRAAIAEFDQAIDYFKTSEDRYRCALAFYSAGVTYAELSEFRKAADYYEQALPLFHQLGEQHMEGSTLNNLGGAYDVLGDLQKALALYESALDLVHAVGDQPTEASTLNNIGKIHGDMSDWQKAIEYYDQALPLFQALGDHVREAITLTNIGSNYNDIGQAETALDYFRRALPLHEAAGDKQGQADTLERMGTAYLALAQPEKAILSYEQALALRRATDDRWRTGLTLRLLGTAYSSQGEAQKALACLEQSLPLLQAAEDRRDQAIALDNMGEAYNLLGQPQKAIEYHQQALVLLQSVSDLDQEARARLGLARAQRDLGNLSEARQQIEPALSLVEQVRARVGSEQQRASYFATQHSIYEFYIDLLMRLHQQNPAAGYDAQALEASERARARSLLEMLAEARVDFREGVDQALLERERSTAQLLNSKAQRLLEAGSAESAQAAVLKKEIGALQNEFEQVEGSIRMTSPRYAAITQPEPLGIADIQQNVLDADTMLLEYSLGDERSYLWALTSTQLKTFELPRRSAIEKSVREVYELLTARTQYRRGELLLQRQERIAAADAQLPQAAARLSQMVLGAVASDLGTKRLVLVTDGSLQHVPFAMLPIPGTPDTPLVAEHELVHLPSASTVRVLRKQIEGRKPAPGMLAVFADPVFGADDARVKEGASARPAKPQPVSASRNNRILEHLVPDSADPIHAGGRLNIPRLPFTRDEADRILKLVRGKDNLEALDFRASLAMATSPQLSRYRYLHFATHGYLDSEHPELSAIVLSLVDEHGRPQEGFLRTNEIYNLNLPAELVVLSACQTGLGKEIRGEGIVGLTRGFMYAGVPRVVVSLWSVNDRATEKLMAIFYEKLLNEHLRPSAALRQAQVEMWKQKAWSAPFYWAAFVQQGEWK
jgi:CHAT domain-containing protein